MFSSRQYGFLYCFDGLSFDVVYDQEDNLKLYENSYRKILLPITFKVWFPENAFIIVQILDYSLYMRGKM